MATVGSSSFGTLIKQLRLAAGMTQEALAERAGVSAKAVSDLERDPTRIPRLETVTLLAEALELEPEGRARLLAAARPSNDLPVAPIAPERAPHALPRTLTPLFGRAGIVTAIAEIVGRGGRADETRLLTLTGPGGVGKTRVAIAAAERAADAFADGVVFVDLAPSQDSNMVLTAIAQQFDIDERDNIPLHQLLAANLRHKCLLLLLDNFEHLIPARAEVLALLEASPRLVVLVTSRVALRVRGEREYRVAPLELPDEDAAPGTLARSPAVELFLDRARATGADLELDEETAPSVAEICRRLDGLPLAIELAAAWTRLLSPPALLTRLERRLPLLVGAPHDLPARQQTMRDTIAWSHDLLNADEQQLFRQLSIFVGGCTPEAAKTVCANKDDDSVVLAGLAALFDRSFLRPQDEAHASVTGPRLTMLETLREYGLEQLEEHGEVEALHWRHAQYYLELAEAAEARRGGPDEAAWGDRLEREYDNLRTALNWSLARGHAETALRLSGALWHFWSERGHVSEGSRWLREALDLPIDAVAADAGLLIKALIGSAKLAIDQGAFGEAEEPCEQAVALARQSNSRANLMVALNTHGLLTRVRGDYRDSTRHHEEALALAQELKDQLGIADAYIGLGYARMFAGDVARGSAFFDQSLAIFRAVGNVRGLAEALVAIAGAMAHTGAIARSEALANEALALFRALGDTGETANALWILGVATQFQEQFERAEVLHQENLALRRERGDEHGTIQPLSALAQMALQRRQLELARTLLEETLELLNRYDDHWSRAMSLTLLGHVELAAGDQTRAAALFAECAPLFEAIGNPLYLSWCLEGFAGVAAARGMWALTARLSGARDALKECLGLGVPPADPAGYAQSLAASRDALGEDVFGVEYEVGRSLSPDRAVAEVGSIVADNIDC
jgi:predicted ATPase/transcriptional regulator with XRE-family HTH domain